MPEALTIDLARAELRRAAVAAFGERDADRLLRTFEKDVLATAHALVGARYQALVETLARALPAGTEDVQEWLDDIDLAEDLLRARVEAVELALGPILGGREGDGSLEYSALAELAADVQAAATAKDESAASVDAGEASQE